MEKNQKKVLIIVGIILVIIAVSAVILSFVMRDDNDELTKKPVIPADEIKINKEISVLNDATTFFNIQRVINEYYSLFNYDAKALYDLIDSEYRNQIGLTVNNIFEKLNQDYASITFMPLNIYYNPNSDIVYYFVNGYYTNYDVDNDIDYKNNVKFLIKTDKKRHYSIMPLDSAINLEEYAKNYDIKEIEINNNTNFNTTSISTKNKLILYLSSFKTLLTSDSKLAYDMLMDDTKNNYNSYEDFLTHIYDIDSRIFTGIFSYSEKEEENGKVYKIISNDQQEITILEHSIMNYKIAY